MQTTMQWIAEGRALFAVAADRLQDNQVSWDIGVQLAHKLKDKGNRVQSPH